MRIKLLKKHNGTAKGSILDVPIARADYLVKMGIAEKFIESKKEAEPKAPKVSKATKEQKEKAEPKKQPPKK